jgi:hypothetical protein
MEIVKVELDENTQKSTALLLDVFNKASVKEYVFFGFIQSVLEGLLSNDPNYVKHILSSMDWVLKKTNYALVNKITLQEAMMEEVEPEVEPPYTCPNCEYIEEGLCGDCYVDTLIESQMTN